MATENEERLMYERYILPNLGTGATPPSDISFPTTGATHRIPLPPERILPLEQRFDTLESRMTALERFLESKGIDISMELTSQLRISICEKLSNLLNAKYRGKIVAITYDGKILASANTDIKLMKKLDEMKYPADQIFLHRVGAKSLAGWI